MYIKTIINTLKQRQIEEWKYCQEVGIDEYIWAKLKEGYGDIPKILIYASFGYLGIEVPKTINEELEEINLERRRIHKGVDTYSKEIEEILLKSYKDRNEILNKHLIQTNKKNTEKEIEKLQTTIGKLEIKNQEQEKKIKEQEEQIREFKINRGIKNTFNPNYVEVDTKGLLNKPKLGITSKYGKYCLYEDIVFKGYTLEMIDTKYGITKENIKQFLIENEIEDGELKSKASTRSFTRVIQNLEEKGIDIDKTIINSLK